MLYIAAMAIAIAACTDEEYLAPEANGTLTVSATLPGDAWAVASRTENLTYSEWTLYYKDKTNVESSYSIPQDNISISENGEVTFTTGTNLVWEHILNGAGDETFHLTCVSSEGVTYYAGTKAAHAAKTVSFTTPMKPTVAKFTVNLTLMQNLAYTDNVANTFTIKIGAMDKATDFNPHKPTNGLWPKGTTPIGSVSPLTVTTEEGSNVYHVTGTMYLPEQVMDNTLQLIYNSGGEGASDKTICELDLSTISVKGGTNGQKANQLKAGQHLTLNIKLSHIVLDTPSLEYEAFADADADDYEDDLGGTVKTFEYEAEDDELKVKE